MSILLVFMGRVYSGKKIRVFDLKDKIAFQAPFIFQLFYVEQYC